ncbi:MAG: hypothetical protein CVT88_02415 [Candidatus Altiarchaeales archaeon HGW-Altiarchaeales-1]|nr:MAG: hypothetical protein CVT89_06450 [Candidatus Altiarchaeales archaeon HGW-Altiarchaeales-2]PKP60642.1 MAG: hypothetical protein CVT88_02415 [Candidatus Altiarchaeales archaeon HGW-Altiarchaeales-1]
MKKVKLEPKEFWDDMNWGRAHYSELVKNYPDKWIAIVDKKVIAAGDSINHVEEEAMKKTGKSNDKIPVMFVECGEHIY